jgi:hypothetical protein
MTKPHQTPLGSFVRSLLHAFEPRMPILVCKPCLRDDDEVVGEAGDLSLCDRCMASITSKTGLAVRRRRSEQ